MQMTRIVLSTKIPAQGDVYEATKTFTLKAQGKRKITINEGDVFSVTSTKLFLKDHGAVLVDRYKRAVLMQGYPLTLEQLTQFFKEVR
jgi:hypothetical protein